MDFFNEYGNFTKTGLGASPNRLNHRYQGIIDWNKEIIEKSRVLDIASHDGRWAFAAIKAGAKHVTCIEARQHHVNNLNENMKNYNVINYSVIQGDVHDEITKLDQQYDVIFCLGFFYHTLEHGSLMKHFERLNPSYVIFDCDIVNTNVDKSVSGPVIKLKYENTKNGLFAVGEEDKKLVGTPTVEAIEMMCDAYGFSSEIYDYQPSLEYRNNMYVGENRSRITLRAKKKP